MRISTARTSARSACLLFLAALSAQSLWQQAANAAPQLEQVRGGALEKAMPLEEKAYYRYIGPFYKEVDYKSEYMKQLSPGGKVYFLANRHDFVDALEELKKLPKSSTGSALYVKAFCLENLGKHSEAAAAFAAAKSKIDLVFHPGFRFYLQSSRASLNSGNEKGCLEDLKTARAKVSQNTLESTMPGRLSPVLDRRTVFVYEFKGKYKEAFEGYLSTFNIRGDQFNLKGSIVADEATKQKAATWLKNNSSVPAGATDVETAKFYVTQGKAYLATANIPAAKVSLEKASAVEVFDPPLLSIERDSVAERGKLRAVNDQARVILVKLYYLDKNYQKGCLYLRKLYTVDPQIEIEKHYNIISMSDVPQLVQQKDVALHSVDLENRMDYFEAVAYSPNKKQLAQVYSYYKDPTYLKARDEANTGRFGDSFDSLAKFMSENFNTGKSHKDWSFQHVSRQVAFLTHFQHAAKLLQIAVGIAAGKQERGLSLSFDRDRTMSDQWLAIEDVLLGRKMRDPKHALSTGHHLTLKEFDEYCRFAAGTRAMDKKEFKLAAKEFGRISPPDSKVDSIVPQYARALKKWCEQQR